MKKTAAGAVLALLCALLGFLCFFFGHFLLTKPGYRGKVSLPGLKDEVEVVTDSWGVPHVFARNEEDLFLAAGYVQAGERMWQMELTRRTGSGRLSEIVGDAASDSDALMRNLGLMEAALRDYELLPEEMKTRLAAYARGVNAWLGSRGWKWPPEFLLLRHRPEPWSIIDSLIIKEVMALLLCADFPSEALRALLVSRLGAERALEIMEEGIPPPSAEVPEVRLTGFMRTVFAQESNNWAVSGERSVTGKPLLANDPHLQIDLPPIWLEMHLHCPTINAAGVTLPGVPLVIIGHNDNIAWGVTNSAVDVQDLYIERFNESGDMYWDQGGWRPLEKKEERIRVKGEKMPRTLTVLWTSRGPVITPLILQSKEPLSLRWTLHDGGRTLEAVYRLNQARDWDSFRAALRLFDTPSQNFVYADREGNIGYYLSGKIPVRGRASALYPFPAWEESGRWKGFLDEGEKPNLFNPEEGMVLTANHDITPEGYPHYLSVDWDASFRADRIRELLLHEEKHSLETFRALQRDVYAMRGEKVLDLVSELEGSDGPLAESLEMLRNWDRLVGGGSAPALYEAFMDALPAEVFQDELGDAFRVFDLLFRRKKAGLLRILDDPDSPWFDDRETVEREGREEALAAALSRAYGKLEWLYGPPENWDWSRMNAVRLRHVLGRVPLFRFFNLGRKPAGGDAFTVGVNYVTPRDSSWSASCRQVIDLSDWDRSVCVVTSGNSGHFMSRFYRNQVDLWLSGRYHPMWFSRSGIERNAAGTMVLEPGS